MLIGIDMLAVQSPGGRGRESARLARRLVAALLALDPSHRYVLYAREGMPTDRIPSGRNALRVALAGPDEGEGRGRATLGNVIARNPDGLDWLVLLDPRGKAAGSPLDGVRIASMVADSDPPRRHDALFTFSESTAAECRRQLGSDVTTLPLILDETWASPDDAEDDAPARLGIDGPFLLANVASGADRSNLGGILEAYGRLPVGLRDGHRLAIAGAIDDPWGVVARLHALGCAEGVVLVGEVDDPTLRGLYRGCSGFVSPGRSRASALPLAEAMARGAAIVAGREGDQVEVVGDAGLFADPADPAAIAGQVARLLFDVDLANTLRRKALARSRRFAPGPSVERFLAALGGGDEARPRPRVRIDAGHPATGRPVGVLGPESSTQRLSM